MARLCGNARKRFMGQRLSSPFSVRALLFGTKPFLNRGSFCPMAYNFSIRPARPDERTTLESLQWRASLNNPGDRDALLANPDAIALPIEQIANGSVFVAESDGVVAGFAAVVPRP